MRDNIEDTLPAENKENEMIISALPSSTSKQTSGSSDLEDQQPLQKLINDGLCYAKEDKSSILNATSLQDCPEKLNCCKCNPPENITVEKNDMNCPKHLMYTTTKSHHQEVHNNINNKKFSIIPPSLEHLIEGHLILADSNDSKDFSPPTWCNLEKYKLGQQFAQKYFYGLCYAEMLSLILLFSIKDNVDPLIFTKKSTTPFTAFRRYLSTVERVRSWYRTDVFDPSTLGHKSISIVRLMHRSIRQRMNSATSDEMSQRTKIADRETCCPLLSHVREDTKSIPPIKRDSCCPLLNSKNQFVYVNQFDMSLTQFAFVGLMILNPEKFGAINATEKELDGFVHLWAIIGYLLGIQDKYNFCIGGLHECQKMSQDAILYWFIPAFRELGREWEHMSLCVVEGLSYYIPENNFSSSLVYLCWVLNIPVPNLKSVMTWWAKSLFNIHRFVFCTLARLPGQNIIHNWILNRRIDNALNASREWLQNKEKRSEAFIAKYNSSNNDIDTTPIEKFSYITTE